MSSAKQRMTLNNLNEPQQLRELNRQLTWIWDQLLGGLPMKALSGDARAVIDSKASSEVVDELGNVVGEHSTRFTQTAEEISAVARRVEGQKIVDYLTDGKEEREILRGNANVTTDFGYDALLKETEEKEFVFSFEGRSEPAGLGADFYFRSNGGGKISDCVPALVRLTDEYRKYAMTVTLSGANTTKDISQCRFRVQEGTGVVYIRNARLERRSAGEVRLLETSVVQNAESIALQAEKTVQLGESVSKNTAELSVQADRITGVVERVSVLEGGSSNETLLEMEDGSMTLISSATAASYTPEELGVQDGDSITWKAIVSPDAEKNIGLNLYFLPGREDALGEAAHIAAGGEAQISCTATVPDGTTNIGLYLYDNAAATKSVQADVSYRDSVILKETGTGGEYIERSEFEQTAGEIRAEVEKKLNADDPAKSVDTKAGVVINAEGVRMYGENIEMETSDGESYARLSGTGFSASSIQSPDVTPRYAGPTAIYIDPAAAKEGEIVGADGERRYYYRSLADALSRLSGKAVNEDVTIWMQAGAEEYAHVGLEGVFGAGKITLSGRSGEGSNYRLNGCLNIHQCAVQVTVYRMDIVSPDNAAIEISACQYVSLAECSLTRENTPLLVTNGSKAKVNDTVLNGSSRAAMVNGDAQAFFLNTSGNGQLIVFGGGIMLAAGTTPSGGAGALTNDVFGGGLYVDAGVTNGAGTTAPEVEAVQTAEILASATDSYGTEAGWTIRNQSGVQDNDVRQGWGEGIGKVFGCMWFDVSRFAGRTVKQASLRLCKVRDDLGGTGRGTEVTVHLYGTTKTGAAGSMNENGLHDYGEIGTVVPGAPNVITIPAQAAQALADGTIKGLVLYCMDENGPYKAGKTHSRNYMRFYGETSGNAENMPMLTVTYA